MAFQPISMVIAIQANAGVESILPAVRRIPEFLNQLVLGENGRAAVLTFDHRLELRQPFTTDFDRIYAAIRTIHAGSSTSRLTDAIGGLCVCCPMNPRATIVLFCSSARLAIWEAKAGSPLCSSPRKSTTSKYTP